jgi:hypothetical protein
MFLKLKYCSCYIFYLSRKFARTSSKVSDVPESLSEARWRFRVFPKACPKLVETFGMFPKAHPKLVGDFGIILPFAFKICLRLIALKFPFREGVGLQHPFRAGQNHLFGITFYGYFYGFGKSLENSFYLVVFVDTFGFDVDIGFGGVRE